MREHVMKHTGAIEIAGSITGQQRKLWNVLLGYAYSELLEKEEHQISLRLLAIMLDYSRTSYERLKDDLRALVETVVEWNILKDDDHTQSQWTVCSMLSGVSVQNGVVSYGYYPRLRELLYCPQQFGRINLIQQLKIKSKYALIIYELCENYWQTGQTPMIPVDRFRSMMGVAEMEWRDVQRRLIQEPLEQVNVLTSFHVAVQTYKQKRKVTHIQLMIIPKKKLYS